MGANLLTETICAPLGVKDTLGDVVAVRHPMFANDDLSMNVGNNMCEGTAVMQLSGSVDGLLKANTDTIVELNQSMKKEIAGYFLVHCGGRRLGIALANREEEIYDSIKRAAGNKPFLVVFTFGEYGYRNHSANTCGGLSLSYTGFSK